MAQNTLLICFDFPPNEGIGGRRWAKLAKGLAKRGNRIQVIKADPKSRNNTSPWTEEVEHENITIHSLPRTYPEVLSDPGIGIIAKLRYRFERWKMRRGVAGTIYDLSIGWDRLLVPKALEIIDRENIVNLIITGAPFNLFDFAADLKEARPGLKLILDFRDPWLTAVNYGIPALKYLDFLEEKRKQHRALESADIVCCPNEFMLEEIHASDDYRKVQAEFKVIPHFYDQDDINTYLKESQTNKELIRFVYGGTLYMGLEESFANLCRALDHLRTNKPELYQRIRIELYSKDLQFSHWFSDHSEVIKLQAPIGKDLFHRISEANACFIFLAHHNKNYRTTKFFEILPFGKPLVYLGEKGFVSEFINEKQLGWVLGNPEQDFARVVEDLNEGRIPKSHSFDYREFSLDKVSELLEGWLA